MYGTVPPHSSCLCVKRSQTLLSLLLSTREGRTRFYYSALLASHALFWRSLVSRELRLLSFSFETCIFETVKSWTRVLPCDFFFFGTNASSIFKHVDLSSERCLFLNVACQSRLNLAPNYSRLLDTFLAKHPAIVIRTKFSLVFINMCWLSLRTCQTEYYLIVMCRTEYYLIVCCSPRVGEMILYWHAALVFHSQTRCMLLF